MTEGFFIVEVVAEDFNHLFGIYCSKRERIILNGQSSSWLDINDGVSQGSVSKLFAYDNSIFSTVSDIVRSSEDLNREVSTVTKWAFKWKMAFNPDPNKQAVNHPALYFINVHVATAPFEKHLGLFLDEKLTFSHHLNEKIAKVNNGIGFTNRLIFHVNFS